MSETDETQPINPPIVSRSPEVLETYRRASATFHPYEGDPCPACGADWAPYPDPSNMERRHRFDCDYSVWLDESAGIL